MCFFTANSLDCLDCSELMADQWDDVAFEDVSNAA